jgi:putative FmdB family regulatory protein
MPTYEYKCSACDHHFEIIQSIKDEPLKICPNCGEETLRKLISGGAALIFKGSGFYLTDYKNKPDSGNKTSEKSKSTATNTKPAETSSKGEAKNDTSVPAKGTDSRE